MISVKSFHNSQTVSFLPVMYDTDPEMAFIDVHNLYRKERLLHRDISIIIWRSTESGGVTSQA